VIVINVLALLGFLGCGVLLLAGYTSGDGGFYGLAAYIGWFLCAYSGVAYLVRGVLATAQQPHRFWPSLYPVNLGLALLGVCVFAIRDIHTVFAMAGAFLVGIGIAYFMHRTSILEKPATPILLLLASFAVFVPPVDAVWNLLFASLAGLAIGAAGIAYLRLRTLAAS
jgi:hypothetical protein